MPPDSIDAGKQNEAVAEGVPEDALEADALDDVAGGSLNFSEERNKSNAESDVKIKTIS